jgi:cytochrome c5
MVSGTEDEGHSSAIKTPEQLITVLVAAFIFPILIILLLARLAIGNAPADQEGGAFSDQAVAARLKPVGTLVLAGESPEPDMTPAANAGNAVSASVPPASSTTGGDDKGKTIYTSSCAACHSTGVAGAPKLGDKAAWDARIKTGAESLYTSAIKGKNAMPPKGGNASLSDTDVKSAVDYMVSQAK